MDYDYEQIEKLSKEIGTPAYIVNRDLFVANLRSISNAFMKRYARTIIGYSFKTNYIPYICALAKQEDCWAEVVSNLEYQIAQRVGFKPQQIIFNGPIKREKDFVCALEAGSLVNIDSFYEIKYLEHLRQAKPQKPIQVGVRVNVAIKDENGDTAIYGNEKNGRFGFVESELPSVFKRLRELNCDIICLHGHTSSKNRAINNYLQILDALFRVQKNYELNLSFIDIGGGFFGPVPAGIFNHPIPTYEEYAERIVNHAMENDWFRNVRPQLIIEPGMSVAASSMSFITRVYDIKKHGDRIIAQVDGDMFQIRQNLYQFYLPHTILMRRPQQQSYDQVDFCGATCMESDILVRESNCSVDVDDFLLLHNVGAYTFVMASSFIQYLPTVVVYENNQWRVLRDSNDFDNFIKIYHW